MQDNSLKIAYIIGNQCEALTSLPNVFTLNQFFKALCDNALPSYSLWIVGQGISAGAREILNTCAQYREDIKLYANPFDISLQEYYALQHTRLPEDLLSASADLSHSMSLEWKNFHFVDPYRVEADCHLLHLSEEQLLEQDFLWIASREMNEKACLHVLPNSRLLIRQAQFQRYLQFFPIPLKVETQFSLQKGNDANLKSVTRFYQDYSCVAQVTLQFDVYTSAQARELLESLGKKTFSHLAENVERDM